MGTYPKNVQLAWEIVDQFIIDWQKNPYYYLNEKSIQAEIYSRIKKQLEKKGDNILKANYIDKWVQKGYENKQNWSRVAIEPAMYYKEIGNKWVRCHPDIVIWDDSDKTEKLELAKEKFWPALWVCEIKVNFKDRDESNDDANFDISKMKKLVNSKEGLAQYGCWLNFNYILKPDNIKNDWQDIKGEKKLWKRNCYFPKLRKIK